MGFAYVLKPVPPLRKTAEEREQLSFVMERKKQAFNNVKSFLKDIKGISVEEMYENYKTAYKNEELEMRIKNAPKPVTRIIRTRMDDVVRITKKQKEAKKLKTEFFAKMVEELDPPEDDA